MFYPRFLPKVFFARVMALFLSTHINKVDKKGRVSVPAQFRAELAAESFQGVVLFRSHAHPALEGFAWSYMQEISRRLENFDMFSAAQDDLAMTVFGDSVQLGFDGEGRIVLPADLMGFMGIGERAAFVGLGNKFQLWDADILEKRREEARRNVREKGLTLPRGNTP
jgi:MraZ protein